MPTPIRYFPFWTALAYCLAPTLGFFTAFIPYFGSLAIAMAVYGGLPLTYIFTVIIALPLFTMFRRMNYFRIRHFAIGGIICAFPIALLFITASLSKFQAYSYDTNIIISEFIFFLHLLGVGFCSGLWFWFIGIWLPNHKLKESINGD